MCMPFCKGQPEGLLVKEDRSWGRMISCPCPISWRKNTAVLQCDPFKEGPLYGLGRVELTSQAGHYSTSSSCPRFSQSSWPLLSFLPGKLCILSVHLLPPVSGGQHSAEGCCVVRTEFTRGTFLSSVESSSLCRVVRGRTLLRNCVLGQNITGKRTMTIMKGCGIDQIQVMLTDSTCHQGGP